MDADKKPQSKTNASKDFVDMVGELDVKEATCSRGSTPVGSAALGDRKSAA
jgi:hypothetical protein